MGSNSKFILLSRKGTPSGRVKPQKEDAMKKVYEDQNFLVQKNEDGELVVSSKTPYSEGVSIQISNALPNCITVICGENCIIGEHPANDRIFVGKKPVQD